MTVLLWVLAAWAGLRMASGQPTPPSSSPFPQGVASGEVTPYSAVLWTRAPGAARVTLEMAAERDFRTPVFQRTVDLPPDADGIAKVEARPLRPATTYFYRWQTASGDASETGTFRTAPAPGDDAPVRFVWAGDSDGTLVNGQPPYNRFEVLARARAEQPDFFVYLGDTVYTDSEKRAGPAAETLEQYRATYRENRSYAALRDLMRDTSTYAMWDDHEFRNDFYPAGLPPGIFATGRRAFFDYMPVAESYLPDTGCAGRPLFRLFLWGREALLIILDERSCRDAPATAACADAAGAIDLAPALAPALRSLAGLPAAVPPGCLTALADPARTMIGRTQRELLELVLRYFPARFKFVMTEVPVSRFLALPYDRWEGYAAERAWMLGMIERHRIPNVVFLAADLHATLVSSLRPGEDVTAPAVAQEVVVGPIAIDPLRRTLERFPGFSPTAVNLLLPQFGIECFDMNDMAYGVVDVSDGRARITVKNDAGRVLCEKRLPQ